MLEGLVAALHNWRLRLRFPISYLPHSPHRIPFMQSEAEAVTADRTCSAQRRMSLAARNTDGKVGLASGSLRGGKSRSRVAMDAKVRGGKWGERMEAEGAVWGRSAQRQSLEGEGWTEAVWSGAGEGGEGG